MFPATSHQPPATYRGFALPWLLLVALLLTGLARAQELSSEDQPLREFLEDLQSFSAGFEQVLHSEFGEELERSRGTVHIQRPGRFNWTYFEPYSQSIISDGNTLWIYDADLAQATVKDASHSLGDSPASILDGSGDIDTHYVVLNTGVQEGVAWLELTPRDADSDYATIRLGFAGKELSGMVLFDNLGQKTVITFKDARRNQKLEESQFTFTPPPGLDVIDTRASATQ